MSDDLTRNLGGEVHGERTVRELRAGEKVGEWVLERILGGGGFGTVYQVRHDRTQQPAALKLLHARLVTSAEMLARFEREVEILRRLDHPNIVHLIEAGFSADDRPYLCMELLDGEDLGKFIELAGPLDPRQALAIFSPLCEALALAHQINVIHRDVKAWNVIVCKSREAAIGRVVLLDFGIAKLSDALAPELTASRQSLGTPSCMAPEQIHGLRVDARTDVYALGCLLFHMVTARLPFQDSSATMTQYLHLHARRPNASAIAAVPRRLDDVIVRAMAIEPAERFDDTTTLLAATRSALRESMAVQIPTGEVLCVALLVTAADRSGGRALDAALLDDLEAVLPHAERVLAMHGFQLAVDLGSSALFVARAETVAEPVRLANAVFQELAHRPRRDPRVRVGVAVHADVAKFVGLEIQPGPLLHPASWNLPDANEGVWVSAKLAHSR